MYGHPGAGLENAWEFVAGRSEQPMVELGWKSVGLLELAALPSLPADQWTPLVRQADVLLVSGGDALYLAHWVRESGLVDLLPSLEETVWLGMSAGSMVMAPRVGEDFIQWRPPGLRTERWASSTSRSARMSSQSPDLPGNSLEEAAQWAAGMSCPAYAIDDETAIRVVGGRVDVVSEGHWQHYPA